MGEPVTVVQLPTSRPGYVRFETNRSFTGMGHESYRKGDPIHRDRPADLIAKALFEVPKVEAVHVYAQAVSVEVGGTAQAVEAAAGEIKTALEELHIHYGEGVEVPTPESFGAEA